MDGQTLPIRLYPESEFTEIKNPYETWVEGGEVSDPNMFYGRWTLVDNLVSTLRNASTNKSVIIYGQKRTGKSSVLYWLKQQLNLPLLPIKFSIGEIIEGFSIENFLFWTILQIEGAFDELAQRGLPEISLPRPSEEAMRKNPQIVFHDYMAQLRKITAQQPAYQNIKLLLLIDEFSYIYTQNHEGTRS